MTAGLLIAALFVAIGACAQSSVGFGLGLIAAPVLAFVDDDFVPGPLLIVALVLTILVARRERGRLDWHGVKWAVFGRIPGSIVGVIAVVLLPEGALIVLFAVLVIVAVILSAAGWRLAPTTPALFTAGAASGLMGSVTSVGGPPMALVYQHRSGPELRSTLALFFVFGSALSISLLAIAGEVHRSDLGRAAVLAPAMLVGYFSSRYVSHLLDHGYVRPVVLWFSALASAALLVTELFL